MQHTQFLTRVNQKMTVLRHFPSLRRYPLVTAPGLGQSLRVCPIRRLEDRLIKMAMRQAKFQIGQIVHHRFFPFRGVIFDVDPVFSSTEEWWLSIPEDIRPVKDQPFYHLLAENEESTYVAYVSEQNLLPDDSGRPVAHPEVEEIFGEMCDGRYVMRQIQTN